MRPAIEARASALRPPLMTVLLCAGLLGAAPRAQQVGRHGHEAGVDGQEAGAGIDGGSVALGNPLPYSDEVIAHGRKHYLRYCQSCHGYDGRARENIDFEAADLTRPSAWRYGTGDGDVFRTTKEGAGQDMPPFANQLEDEEIWELVHYIRSLGPEELRPKQVGAANEAAAPRPDGTEEPP